MLRTESRQWTEDAEGKANRGDFHNAVGSNHRAAALSDMADELENDAIEADAAKGEGMAEHLERESCRECKKSIMVAKWSPHPLAKNATGMAASRFDHDTMRDYFVGWICNECAWESAMKKGGGCIGGGGTGDMDFCY